MMRLRFLKFLLLALCMLPAACNDDIFVEDMGWDDGDVLSIKVEGDGGEASFKIATKDLLSVQVNSYHSGDINIGLYQYYDKAGEKAYEDIPASELGKVVGDFTLQHFELIKDGNRLIFRSLENCSGQDREIAVRLEYTYTVRFIDITILKGEPLQLVSTDYVGDIIVDDNAGKEVTKENFTNDGPLPQVLEIRPYISGYQTLSINDVAGWALSLDEIRMPVLHHDGAGWSFADLNIRLGADYLWTPDNWKTKVELTVPEYSRNEIVTTLFYTKAEAGGDIVFRKPVTGVHIITPFRCTASKPYKFDLELNEIK